MDKQILEHFRKNDQILYNEAKRIGFDRKLRKTNPRLYFKELCEIIISQQLSGKAADSIFNRFKKMLSGKILPETILKITYEKLRSAGLSNSKARYLRFLAEAVAEKKLRLDNLDSLNDGEVKKQLIQVKGIGPWTAEMFLMFSLGRPDIFSHGDLGLKKGIMKLYGFKKDPSVKTIEKIVNKWTPFKTYAALILWKSLEK